MKTNRKILVAATLTAMSAALFAQQADGTRYGKPSPEMDVAKTTESTAADKADKKEVNLVPLAPAQRPLPARSDVQTAGGNPATQKDAQNQTRKTTVKVEDNGRQPAVDASVLRQRSAESEQQRAEAFKSLEKFAAKPQAAKPVLTLNKANQIAIKPGENVFIPISREHPNRLLTPFKNPQVISSSLSGSNRAGECGELCVRSGVIYVTTDAQGAVTTFITEKGHEEIAFSVTMIPQAIPPREVRFTLPEAVMEEISTFAPNDASLSRAEKWEKTQPYVDGIRDAMRSIALGQVPNGYVMRKRSSKDKMPACKQSGLAFD